MDKLPDSHDLSYWNRPTRQLLMELGGKLNELADKVGILERRLDNLRDAVMEDDDAKKLDR